MYTLEYRLEKAEKALKALRAERDEKLKSPTEGNKYAVAAFIKKDPKLRDYRGIHLKIEAANAKVRHLQDRLHNKQQGGRTRRARGSKKTRRNL